VAKPNKLTPGDRVAYAAKFLKNTGQFTGSAPQRAMTHWDVARFTLIGAWLGLCAFLGHLAAGVIY
jgi:hypothetical protein